MDLKLSRRRYQIFRDSEGRQGPYPTYKQLNSITEECYPENINVTESKVEIPLKDLTEHTLQRILRLLSKEQTLLMNSANELEFICKYGFDSTSGLSNHKVRLNNRTNNTPRDNLGDSSAFVASMVPFVLRGDKKDIWKNPVPSSPRFCRPFEINFTKETDEFLEQRSQYYGSQIEAMEPFILSTKTIKPIFVETMLDGKLVNAVTQKKSTRSCNIWGVRPKRINDFNRLLFRPNESFYKLGLPVLHSKINSMKNMFNIATHLEFKKAEANTEDHKRVREIAKLRIQNQLRDELSIWVEFLRIGTGTSSTGNFWLKLRKCVE